ncbi:MAG: hypothetical protein C4555_05170 [Dehalococcoidia bacterium]|nr:MAG: hypothetical protein C4555_05170 [Dehalococcoidia bacterium]
MGPTGSPPASGLPGSPPATGPPGPEGTGGEGSPPPPRRIGSMKLPTCPSPRLQAARHEGLALLVEPRTRDVAHGVDAAHAVEGPLPVCRLLRAGGRGAEYEKDVIGDHVFSQSRSATFVGRVSAPVLPVTGPDVLLAPAMPAFTAAPEAPTSPFGGLNWCTWDWN